MVERNETAHGHDSCTSDAVIIENAHQERGSQPPRGDDGQVHNASGPLGGEHVWNDPPTREPCQQWMAVRVEYVLGKGPTHPGELTAERTAVCPLPSEGVDVFDSVPARGEEEGIGSEKNVRMQQSHPQPCQPCCLPARGDALDGFVPGLHARKLAVFVEGHFQVVRDHFRGASFDVVTLDHVHQTSVLEQANAW